LEKVKKINWRKVNRWASVSLVASIQVLFLFMIYRENRQVSLISGAVIVLSILLLTAHIKAPLHHEDHFYEHILVALWVPAGAAVTWYINNDLHLGPVLAAGAVGTFGSLLPEFNKRSDYLKHLPPAIYCGAFIGMSSLKVAHGFLFVFAASFFAGVLLVLSKSLFFGMGGKLGLIAFSGVVIASFFLFILSNYGF